jgi:hypothetical protein
MMWNELFLWPPYSGVAVSCSATQVSSISRLTKLSVKSLSVVEENLYYAS